MKKPKHNLLMALAGLSLLATPIPSQAQTAAPAPTNQQTTSAIPSSISAAPALASQCFACHGPAGLSQNSDWPNIAGQQRNYLATQLKAFRSGTRKNDMMQIITGTLTDQDIDQLADYFNHLTLEK